MNLTVAGRGAVALAAVVVGLGATGCAGGGSATSTASSTPTTATIGGSSPSASSPSPSPSDRQAQAYAAAVKTYNDYWRGLENVVVTGDDPTRLANIARADALSYAAAVAGDAKARGYTLKGHITNVYVKPSGFTFGGTTKNPSRVTLTSCQDLSATYFVDKSGRRVQKAPSAAKFIKFDAVVVNFSPTVAKGWVVDNLKTTAVKSCG